MKTTLLLMMLGVLSFSNAQNWYSGNSIPLPVRAGNTAGYSKNGDGFLFVVSGRDLNGQITPKNQRYQLSTNSWTALADHPTGLLGGATTILKDSLYVIGGLRFTPGTAGRRCYKYSINEDSWVQIANFPVALTDAKAVSYQDSLIYVTGGYSGNTYVYNSRYNRWRAATAVMPGESLSWNGFSIKNDTLVVVCGTDGFMSQHYFNTIRRGVIDQNDRSQISWSEGTPFPGQTRTFFDAYTWEGGIIMTGGSTDNTFETTSNECYSYHVATDSWTQLPAKPTAWVTGNSASIKIGEDWSLICASGYAAGYLSQTEIFSTGQPLAVEAIKADDTCSWKDFQVVYQKNIILHFCMDVPKKIDLEITDAHGRIVKKAFDIASSPGLQHYNINNDSLPAGIYYCTLKQDNVSSSKKIIVRS